MAPADIDLYKDDLITPADQDLYAAIELFIRMTSPQTERTQEGYLLDFKATWSDSSLRAVAAFANTFGGLLIVGVSDKDGRADEIVGIASKRQELKTSIASAIASNISPTPPYDLRDVAFPEGSGRHLCIVRVRKGNHLYLLTKKGDQPIGPYMWVMKMRAVLPTPRACNHCWRHMRFTPTRPPNRQYSAFSPFPQHLYVTQAQALLPRQSLPAGYELQRMRSATLLQIRLIPEEPQEVRLDLMVEQESRNCV
jgi:hypothetical protein